MSVMTEPRKRKGRARETGQTVAFQVELERELYDALEACAEAEERTRRAVVQRAVREYLAARGRWDKPTAAD